MNPVSTIFDRKKPCVRVFKQNMSKKERIVTGLLAAFDGTRTGHISDIQLFDSIMRKKDWPANKSPNEVGRKMVFP